MSMRLKKVGDWIQYSTGAGRIFYYNDKNGDFKWITQDVQADNNSSQSNVPSTIQQKQERQEDKSKNTTTGMEHESSAPPSDSLSDWRAYKDPNTGAIFWFNKRTNVSQWECPDQAVTNSSCGPTSGKIDSEEVKTVQSDEDLGLY